MNNRNIYMPVDAEIEEVIALTHDVKLYSLKSKEDFHPMPGQFFMVSVIGYGEVPISVTSAGDEPIKLCIRKAGYVTTAIHSLNKGDSIGLRGPYGRGFPIDIAKGKDVILMAGGLGIAPLRPLIHKIISDRGDYKKAFLLYGSKTPDDIIYRKEADLWRGSINVILSVDRKDKQWKGRIGVVTGLLNDVDANFLNSAAYICGPEVMISASMKALSEKGIPDKRIITTLEAHMKCGVGKCGHCYMGPKYICVDGPVFTGKELRSLLSHNLHSP